MLNELISKLNAQGVNFVKVVDVSKLSANENRGCSTALLVGITLSPSFIFSLSNENSVDHTEYSQKEHKADELAEWIASFIIAKGYEAHAQSEKQLALDGLYNETTKTSPLPHKTIALMAGLGWIGKNNLLVTPEYGSALCISTVLTNAPLPTKNKSMVTSKCCACNICMEACPVDALHGATWEMGINRDLMVDVYSCTMCLKCLSNCLWTQKYMRNGSSVQN